MSELVDFLRARLDEDEATMRACEPRGTDPVTVTGAGVQQIVATLGTRRALADVEAKRRMVDLHSGFADYCSWTHDPNTRHQDEPPCETLRILAQPYAHHPGWREEWRP